MAISNLERYKKDLNSLTREGVRLYLAMQKECFPSEFTEEAIAASGLVHVKSALKSLPKFADDYQRWYSEAKVLVKQLLPDCLEDFTAHYEKPKNRKELTQQSYRILDYLQGLTMTRYRKAVVEPSAAIPQFQQQLAIVRAIDARFESSLFDIRQLVQADLFDSDLDAADELAKKSLRGPRGQWQALYWNAT
jgi:hypothetical protein